ncbi:DEAD/DEAH box helicase [Desulfoluna butyratoxydans]|uniref:Dead/deah box helicase domain n=1 Tax=Desulfoluna butyratoxydans TaxID=231438 RepID=A0A4U8YJI0_9BACT|nr:DEAD/DEAH box helicase [Desulfoluna butyratoxydans]VFQ43801.1 dead/deah box helicase domain [Desulfoluna butyratoxydans]
MIRNLFKRIAEFVTGSSKDDDSSAIPFAELSRKKAEEQAKKERAERKRRPRDKKNTDQKKDAAKSQRGDSRQRSKGKTTKQAPAKRASEGQKPREEKAPNRNGRNSQSQRPQREASPKKEAPKRNAAPKQPKKPAWKLEDFQVPEKEGEVRFHDLDLPIKLMQGIADLGFQYATPIQAGCLPETLKGRDAIGKAQTGTGKSAAFLITIINHIAKHPMRGGPERGFPRALILAPTRELALQIEKDARALCKFTPYTIVSLFGGTGYDKQKKGMAGPVDIIVATPGRLIDFKNQRLVDLSRVEILVIDEADRMLDMGFIPDIRKIVYATPHKEQRQTLFFSATYSSDVMRLAEQWTRDPHHTEIEPETVESASVDQKIFLVTTDEKFPLLYNLITLRKLTKVLVFTNRRDQARNLAERLNKLKIKADLLSGEVAQNKRIRALEDFRSGKVEVLVATDVAARGLHIDEISHVINYNLPQDPEHYVHRIGRTGRAGATGTSVSFACEDDSYYIPAIEELLGHKLSCEYPADELIQEVKSPSRNQRQRSRKPQSSRQEPKAQEADTQKPDLESSQEEDTPREETAPREPRKSRSPRAKKGPAKGPAAHSPWLDPIAMEEPPEDEGTSDIPETSTVAMPELTLTDKPEPKADPVEEPEAAPAEEPEAAPAEEPEAAPAEEPETAPAEEPEAAPAEEPEAAPAEEPEAAPVEEPETAPAEEPEAAPVEEPEAVPVEEPEAVPVEEPEAVPVEEPEAVPVEEPEAAPAEKPEAAPAEEPETAPAEAPVEMANEPKATSRQPKSPRPIRQTRRPNAPKYRKRSGGRYTSKPRTDR